MKKILITLIICSAIQFANSQSGWFWNSPNPSGSNLEDVFFVNENVGYAVGWNGTIIKTINGGSNWVQLNSGINLLLYSVFFTNVDTGYVVSGDAAFPTDGVILKTINGGANWSKYDFNNVGFVSIFFSNNMTGYAAGNYNSSYGALFKTTNAGTNWNQLNIPASFFSSIFFINPDSGYISNDQSIIRTTNGGINWTMLGSGVLSGIQNIYFIDFNTGYAVGYYGRIYKTTNTGNNWLNLNSNSSYHLFSVKAKDSNTVFVVGGGTLQNVNGQFLMTSNGGTNWVQLNYGNNQNLVGLAKLNISNYVAVGNWDMIIKTTNEGANFLTQSFRQNTNNIKSVDFTNENTAYGVGFNSTIFKTTNQGVNWTYSSLGNNYELNSVYFINDNTGYTVGGNVTNFPPYYYIKLLKTTDSGISWNLIYGNNNEYGLGNKILFLNPNVGFIATKGGILRTSNSGSNWFLTYSSSEIYDIYFVDSATGFGCGIDGVIVKSTNTGNNWIRLDSLTNRNLHSIFFTSAQTGYVGGSNNIIMKTINEGVNWSQQNSGLGYELDFTSLHFLDENYGYAVGISFPDYGRAGDIIKTTNGGLSWIHESSRNNLPTIMWSGLNSICFINSSIAFIVGENGVILENTSILNPIGIVPLNNVIPINFSLYQNYPNPFNPTTKIKFDVPNVGTVPRTVRLTIYDILGREVTTLVNEALKSGTYEVEWDAINFASGLYFYKLQAGDNTETKKMVLIK